MAGGGDHPGANKRAREAAGRLKAPSKRAKGKKPYRSPAARGGGGGGSKEKPQPVAAMDKRVGAEEISLPEPWKLDKNLVKELRILCQKVRCCNLSGKERSKLITEALRKMDGNYLEMAESPVTACVLQLCVKWCSQSERDPVFVALQPHLLDLSRNKYTVYLVNYIIKGASKEQFALFISSLHGHVASLLFHTIGASVVDRAFRLATPPQKRSLLLELYSTELQLFKDLTEQKTCRSAMECSFDESPEPSDIDIGNYAKKAYMDMKSGKLVVRFGTDRFTCPFCPGKKKQDYRYRELLSHAIG